MAADFEVIKQIKDDNLFGRLVINLGFASETHVDDCMLKLFSTKSNRSSLAELLVEKGYVTPEAIKKIYAYKDARVLTCPQCGVQYNSILFRPGAKFFCHNCNTELEVPVSELDARR